MNWPDYLLSPCQLEKKYSLIGGGEHPTLTRPTWRKAVANNNTLLGYWHWVSHNLIEQCKQTRAAA